MAFKICKNCKLAKEFSEFTKKLNSLTAICKKCTSDKDKLIRKNRNLLKTVPSLKNENWFNIVGYKGLYMVSDMNRVKSLAKTVVRKDGVEMFIPERLVGVHKTPDGYLMTRISKRNKPSNFLIHRLIAIAAIKNPKNLKEVNHKNAIKTDNSVENLEWVTHHENMIHANVNGLIKNARGSKMSSKLTEADVEIIFKSKEKYPKIAARYNITTSTVCAIKVGKIWNHVTGLVSTRKRTNKITHNIQ